MVSKELIKAEIEKVPDERLDRLYLLVRQFARPLADNGGLSFMSKIKEVTIDGPEDFAENIDLYLSGDKAIG